MRHPLPAFASALAATIALVAAAPASAGTDLGVSIQITQPGVHGRVDIGRFPQPVLVVPQPVVIRHVQVAQPVQPVYVWVPPGHRKNWRKHCDHYGACGVPVYFVQDRWYHDHVAPSQRGRGHGNVHGNRH